MINSPSERCQISPFQILSNNSIYLAVVTGYSRKNNWKDFIPKITLKDIIWIFILCIILCFFSRSQHFWCYLEQFVNHSQCGLTGDFILHVLTIIMLAVIIKKSGTMIAIFLLWLIYKVLVNFRVFPSFISSLFVPGTLIKTMLAFTIL